MPFRDWATRRLDERQPRDDRDGGRHEHQEGDEAVEHGASRNEFEPALEAEGLADHCRRWPAAARGGEDRDAEQADSEQVLRRGAEERYQRHRCLLGRLHDMPSL